MIKKSLLLILSIVYLINYSTSQELEYPVWTVKSHSNLDIEKITTNDKESVFSLIVTSDIDEGAWFCADKNIYLISISDSLKINIIRSENIPVCPDMHKFTKKGEILRFNLYFPPIPKHIKIISLIEDCTNACFYFNDIVLDPVLSKEIRTFEKAIDDYRNHDKQLALEGFEYIVNTCNDKTSFRYSHSLSILPVIYEETNQLNKAERYYQKILNSDLNDRQPTGNKDEYYSNFKHKAVIRLALLHNKKGNTKLALSYLQEAEKRFPLQSIEAERELKYKDHFMIFNHKIIMSNINSNQDFLKLIFTEYINKPFGEIPTKTNQIINDIISENFGKDKFIESFEMALKTILIENQDSKSIITIIIGADKHTIISDTIITEKDAKTQLQQIVF